MNDPMPAKGLKNQFIVDLAGLDLTDEARGRIATAVQRAVVSELAGLNLGSTSGLAIAFGHRWIGLIARPTIEKLEQGEKLLQQQVRTAGMT